MVLSLQKVARPQDLRCLSFLASVFALLALVRLYPVVYETPIEATLATWAQLTPFPVDLSYHLDVLSLIFAALILMVGSSLLLASLERSILPFNEAGHFYALVLVLLAAFLNLVMSNNLLIIYLSWETTTIITYLLLRTIGAGQGTARALVVMHITGYGLLAAILWLAWANGGTFLYSAISPQSATAPLLLLITVAAIAKAAQYPFHNWLNFPWSTLKVGGLYDVCLASAGIYAIARLYTFSGGSLPLEVKTALIVIGSLSIALGSLAIYSSRKRDHPFFYSTMTEVGYIVVALGIGTPAALSSGFLILFGYSLSKAALYLLINGYSAEDNGGVTSLRVVRRPMTRFLLGGGIVSLLGLPPFASFAGKWLLYTTAVQAGYWPLLPIWIGAGALVLAGYLQFVDETFWPLDSKPAERILGDRKVVSAVSTALLLASLILGLAPRATTHYLLGPTVATLFEGTYRIAMPPFSAMSLAPWIGATSLMLMIASYWWAFRSYPLPKAKATVLRDIEPAAPDSTLATKAALPHPIVLLGEFVQVDRFYQMLQAPLILLGFSVGRLTAVLEERYYLMVMFFASTAVVLIMMS